MELKKPNIMKRTHCPNCNCIYIIIDNEIIVCPLCELSSKDINSKIYNEINKGELVQFQF
ncbi:MAG: hypothetical protein ACFE9Z_07325 [Promethearchaeota archaeon]